MFGAETDWIYRIDTCKLDNIAYFEWNCSRNHQKTLENSRNTFSGSCGNSRPWA